MRLVFGGVDHSSDLEQVLGGLVVDQEQEGSVNGESGGQVGGEGVSGGCRVWL